MPSKALLHVDEGLAFVALQPLQKLHAGVRQGEVVAHQPDEVKAMHAVRHQRHRRLRLRLNPRLQPLRNLGIGRGKGIERLRQVALRPPLGADVVVERAH
jgi:hypothetical protein